MTPSELWPMIAAAGGVVFGAGQLVAKIRNGKYTTRETCGLIHAQEKERWEHLTASLAKIELGIEDLRKSAHTHPTNGDGGQHHGTTG